MSTTQPDPAFASELWVNARTPDAYLAGELCNGDKMSRAEFHELYERTAHGFKAELIEGEVYVASPVSWGHARPDYVVGTLLGNYEARTPGVEGGANGTVFLSHEDEVQPDSLLRILPEFGGQTRLEQHKDREYLVGAPELILEVALSSRSIDLHRKRRVYQRYGVLEYVVVCVKEKTLRWFDLRNNATLASDEGGVLKLTTFPGLWLDASAICRHDFAAALKTLEAGLASPEHAEFVARLEAQRQKIAAEAKTSG